MGSGWSAVLRDQPMSYSVNYDKIPILGATQVIGRVTGLAWVAEDDSHLLHLGLGARYSGGKEGLRYRASNLVNPASRAAERAEPNSAFVRRRSSGGNRPAL